MLPDKRAQLLQSAILRVPSHRLLPSSSQCRRLQSTTSAPQSIAVIGGGISGLSSAHFISKEFPNAKITLYEKSQRLGGWIDSRVVQVAKGNVVFESGPRSLRTSRNSLATVKLMHDVGLLEAMVPVARDAPSAKNRFIYYPDQLQLLSRRNLLQLGTSGLFSGLPRALIREPWVEKRPPTLTDESIGSFLARRTDERIANNVISAVLHGIYAGDVWQLSVKSLLPLLWQWEGLHGSLWRAILSSSPPKGDQKWGYKGGIADLAELERHDVLMKEITIDIAPAAALLHAATFNLDKGMGQLVQGLERELAANKNVSIKRGKAVHPCPRPSGQSQVDVVSPRNTKLSTHDIVIDTICRRAMKYVTVMTVSLYYENPDLIKTPGFGYLIPQSVAFEQNPELALGVIFDSESFFMDSRSNPAEGTRLTVMLGGHYWDGWSAYPTVEEGLDMAKSILARHLGITDTPEACHVSLNKDCIPQYTVGHNDKLKSIHEELLESYGGKCRVVGNWTNGVGINDCVTGAYHLARGLRGNGWKQRTTGLETVVDDRPWNCRAYYDTTWLDQARKEYEDPRRPKTWRTTAIARTTLPPASASPNRRS